MNKKIVEECTSIYDEWRKCVLQPYHRVNIKDRCEYDRNKLIKCMEKIQRNDEHQYWANSRISLPMNKFSSFFSLPCR